MEQNTMLYRLSSFLLFSYIIIIFYMNSVPTFGFTNETDMQALLAIRNGIQEDPFKVFSSWNSSHHFCKWQGVTCSQRHHQRVSALNLSSLKLSGSLSPHIGNLTFLRVINLVDNNFHGVIPQAGEFPVNVTRCSDLRVVNLIKNNLRGKVPIHLGSLPKLEYLDLTQNHFIGTIPPALGNLSALRWLYMLTNNLQGQIPIELGKLSNLEVLQLFENKLTGTIPSALFSISTINFLALAINQFHGSLPPNLGLAFPKLETIFMGANQFFGTIPASLANVSGLLGGVLPTSIGNLSTKLVGLNLDQNYISGSIPPEIGNIVNFELLTLNDNHLTGNIPNSIGKFIMMQEVYLYNNKISGKILATFGNMSKLSILKLNQNMLDASIPISLEIARIYKAWIFHRIALPIPSFLGDFSLIQYLNISYNKFEGEVPSKGVFSNISAFSIGGNSKLCGGNKALQLPACPTKISKKQEKHLSNRVLIIAISVPVCIILLLACICATLYWKKRLKVKTTSTLSLGNQHPNLSYAELLQATEGFSLRNLIGEGSYGSVYKGILNSETIRAIVVKIVTVCSSLDFKGNEFKALVFEFISNGNLESWLHSSSPNQEDSRDLNLVQRLNIAVDVASALDYLHNHCETPILHCDLKPSNVLLDDDLSARVSDFGLARICPTNTGAFTHAQNNTSSRIRGTIGYIAPEYATRGEVSIKGDVYSYGILLLEMFTGKRPTDNMFADNFNLHNHVKMAAADRFMEIVDLH
ncbi:hypothetical protein ACSBR1_038071 [Camellia fascicularis]